MENNLNFDKLEDGGKLKKVLNLSSVLSVRIGGFGAADEIRTFLTTLTVEQLKRDIEFYEKLSNDKDWPVSQIIQREVEKDRVNSITKKYLLGEGRLVKYFPPIIIALLPRDESGNFLKEFDYNADQDTESLEQIIDQSSLRLNKEYKDRFLKTENSSNVNGLYLFEVIKTLDHNLFCWDKSKFFAVVIDGQHRLAALLQGFETNQLASIIQDVAFIDVSAFVKKETAQQKATPVEILRSIFIDINTNAKSVSLVRRILIDDKDLASLGVQSLVDSVFKNGTAKSPDLYIPSSLIDWHGESYKHEWPHLTGVLTLNQILSDELVIEKLISIEDHRNQGKIKRFIDLLNEYFFVDNFIKKETDFSDYTQLQKSFTDYLMEKSINLETFAEELKDADMLDSFLFNYDYRTLEVAQYAFEKLYLKSIRNLLTEFHPYKIQIDIVTKLGGLDSKSDAYRALLTTKVKILKNDKLKEAFLSMRKELNSRLSDKFYLFSLVVGQKALFKVYFERLFKEFKFGVDEDFILGIQKLYLAEMNELTILFDNTNFKLFGKDDIDIGDGAGKELQEYGTVACSFWEGILFEDKRIVYNTQGVRAYADVIIFCLDSLKHLKGGSKPNFNNYTIRFSSQRTKRLLKKRFNRTEEEYNTIAKQIISSKKVYLFEQINKCFTTAKK